MNLIKPTGLRKGDTISIVVPAGPIDRERIDRALKRVQKLGFRTKTYGDIYRSRGYLAGDDETRAKELMAAFEDPKTSAVWCARGGYGVARLLDRLDFSVIHRRSKVFVGFSDITALHIPINNLAGMITFHGPNLQDGFGKPEGMSPGNEWALWRAIAADQQKGDEGYEYDFSKFENVKLRTVHGGKASGQLTGGNLAVLVGLMGTKYEIQTAGRILFLEDVGERLYRIDRYLAHLKLAGKLQQVAGVLVGSFSYDPGDSAAEKPEAVDALLDEYLSGLDVPVLAGFPAGHAQHNATLPMGARIEIDVDARRVKVLESAVTT